MTFTPLTPLEAWLAEEGVTVVRSQKEVFTDPAIYIMPNENQDYTRIFKPVTAETEAEFAEQIAGQRIIVKGSIVQCPRNWGENYGFSDEGLTSSEEPAKVTITRNIAECALCHTVIESKHVHDFVTCKCGEIFTDGGTEYIRRGATNLDNIIDLSEWEE